MEIIIINDKPTCNEQQQQDRKKLCLECENYSNGICKECDCLVDRKIVYIEGNCPIGRW